MKQATVGHPVDVVTGTVFTAWTDFSFKGRTEVVWRRFYSNGNQERGPLGRGWTTRYLVRLERHGDDVVMIGDEGHAHAFRRPVGGKASTVSFHPWALYEEQGRFRLYDRHTRKSLHFSASLRRPGTFLLHAVEDLNGSTLQLHYGADDRLIAIEQPSLLRRIVFAYNPAGTVASITLVVDGHAPGLLVRYDYDSAVNLVRATDAQGGAIEYLYDERQRLAAERNQLGGCFHFEYDAEDRCVHTWGDGGYLERQLEYDTRRGVTRVTDGLGAKTEFHHAKDGRITSKVDALGRTYRYFHAMGVDQRIAPDGSLCETEVNAEGDLIRRTDELRRSFLFTYDDLGQVTTVVDPGGSVSTHTYDDRGLRVATTDPQAGSWCFERGPGGEIVAEIDPEGRTTRRRCDPTMRWQEFADEKGHYRCEYNIFGRQVIASNTEGVVMTWTYDAVGRVTRTQTRDGRTVEMRYDAAGNLISRRDESGADWHFRYDAFGRIVALRDPLGHEIRIEYDREGRRVCVVNARGERHEDVLDLAGQVIERKFFDGSRVRYTWDVCGRMSGIAKSNGDRIELSHDAAGHVIKRRAYSTRQALPVTEDEPQSTEYSYNWRGMMTAARDADSSISFSYDLCGRILGEEQNGMAVSYAYDKSGRLIQREVRDGSSGGLRFAYGPTGALLKIEDALGVAESYEVDRSGAVVRRRCRGELSEAIERDALDRIRSQRVSQGLRDILVREYQYDDRDNLATVTDRTLAPTRMRYDAALRLTDVESTNGVARHYVYGPGGDLVISNGEARAYEPGSRMVQAGKVTYRYDASGQQVERVQPGLSEAFHYDALGRMVAYLRDGEVVAKYAYDAINRRLSKTDSQGRTTRFVWSNRQLAAVANPGDKPREVLISANTHRPVMAWTSDGTAHYICDPVGAPREAFGERGNLVWQASYQPYGSAETRATVASELFNLRLPGQYFDEESRLHYSWNRYYDPNQTRFLAPDPAGIDAGLNLYDYPRDPVNWTDPYGLSCPNPKLVEENQAQGWQIHEHADGSLTITADCTKGYATPKPGGLRPTIHAGDDNKFNPPEAHLGQDGRLIVMEGTHRSVAASRGQQIPPDPDNPHLGGVPGKPGHMTFEYAPQYNDNQPGVPLQSLNYPPGYPHKI